MSKQGAIVLSTGGDDSDSGQGNFYEGIIAKGTPSDKVDAAINANIASVRYSGFSFPDSPPTYRGIINGAMPPAWAGSPPLPIWSQHPRGEKSFVYEKTFCQKKENLKNATCVLKNNFGPPYCTLAENKAKAGCIQNSTGTVCTEYNAKWAKAYGKCAEARNDSQCATQANETAANEMAEIMKKRSKTFADAPIGWSIGGDGYRAMFSATGFARAYSAAGLFDATAAPLSAVSSNSGGSWFLTQFAYSSSFYNNVTAGTTDDMEAAIKNWYESTVEIVGSISKLNTSLLPGSSTGLMGTNPISLF